MNDQTALTTKDETFMYDAMGKAGAPSWMIEQLRQYREDLRITTWADFQRRFLMGSGKAPATYRTYMVGCRQFFEFTERRHPLELLRDGSACEWIEQWYDSLTVDLNSKVLKVRSLKFMFKKIVERYPSETNPFDVSVMTEALTKKLNRSKKDESQRDSLTTLEYASMLKYLQRDKSARGVQDYGIFRFGVTSGMRAAELVGLRWGNIADTEGGGYSATFVGEGQKTRTIQLEIEAVGLLFDSFEMRFHRKPVAEDFCFNALKGSPSMSKVTLHNRVVTISENGKELGRIRPNLHVSSHVMRHTCATRLLGAGVDIFSVSKHLGHSNISTTNTYLHNRTDLTAAFESMSDQRVCA